MSDSTFYATDPFPVLDVNLTSSNVAETDYPAWSSGTMYSILNERVIVVSADVHSIYENINTAGNINKNPLTEPTFWVFVSTTNRWKMFDNSNTSQTVNEDLIQVELTFTSRPNSVYFGNVEAQTIRLKMTATDGVTVVYDQTFQMYENTGEPASYYAFFTARIRRKQDLFITGLPPLANAKLEAWIVNDGADAKCATMVVGYAEDIGVTLLNASVGIRDFSVKRRNDFGDFEVLERAFSKIGEFSVFCDNGEIDRIANVLNGFRARPIVYIGTKLYGCTFIYGFYNDYQLAIQYNEKSLLNIEIEGLT